MNYMLTFYIGTEKDRYNADILPADRFTMMDEARTYLAQTFGGYTETHTRGGWHDGAQVVEEAGVRFECVDALSAEAPHRKAQRAASRLRSIFRQTSVLVTITPVMASFVEE